MYGSRNRIVISAMALRNTQAMGLLPPVAPFSLLFPYPPNAGRLIKHPPTRFATPSATSSLFALSCIPGKSDEEPRLFAATVDSKKPSSAMTNDVLMASRMCGMFAGWKGQRNVKRRPDAAWMGPRTVTPWVSQPSFQQRTVAMATMRKRSGMKATEGYRGWRCFLTDLSGVSYVFGEGGEY